MKYSVKISLPIITSLLFVFCSNVNSKKDVQKTEKNTTNYEKHQSFNNYWYNGQAEISSYKLTQARYGDIYEGTAVNIFVTEDFLPKKQVKADYKDEKNIAVLKLNSTKKYLTGIYPYSLMSSTFTPINYHEKSLKISFSAQEWCGNTFVQLNNKENFEIDYHSYFESNADRKLSIEKEILENELWNQLRVSPENLPLGNHLIIPSFEYLALNHQKIKSYKAEVSIKHVGNLSNYTIYYPELKRTLIIKFSKEFPYTIEGWEEIFFQRGKELKTIAEKIKTIKSAYWGKNKTTDTEERKSLGL